MCCCRCSPAGKLAAEWPSTLTLLRKEVAHLRKPGTPVVLQIAMREQDFRIDGMPRARAVPRHPGVILSIESRHGALSYPCDRFDRWQDNVRAIALGLEALRKVDRYGITKRGEQYTGWRAIESAASPSFRSADEAERVLRLVARIDDDRKATLPTVIRAARANAHPDRNDGNRENYDLVDAAVQLLEREGRL